MPKAKAGFFAQHIVATTDRKHGCYVLGLADRANVPLDSVLFQRPFEFDDEAAEAGEDCHWFQYRKASLSAFGACTKARIYPGRLEIDISKKATKIYAATGGRITIEFKPTAANTNRLRKYLERIL